MPKNWTRIAATLLLVGLAMPANATEYGAWKLIDTKTTKQFTPDASAPTDRFGTWTLIDTQFSKVFMPDVALAPVNRFGQWQLADVSFDRRWMSDQFIRRDDLGSMEVGRNLASDDVDKNSVLKESGKKVYSNSVEKLLNPQQQKVNLAQYKRRDSGRPVSSLIQPYRIDTTYDKEVSHPWTITDKYAELEKHTRTYDVTLDRKSRLVFRDPITGQQSDEYSFATEKRKDVAATGFAENGNTFTKTRSGVDYDPMTQVTVKGAVKEDVVGTKAESASAAASSEGASAVAFSSNSQVGTNLRRVGYAGVEERKALAVDQVKLSKKKDKKEKQAESEAAKNKKVAASPLPIVAIAPAPAVNRAPVAPAVLNIAPVLSNAVKNELNQLNGGNDWKDLGEALKAANSKDDLIGIGLAILSGKGGMIRSTEAGLSEQLIRARVAQLPDLSGASKAKFLADSFNIFNDILDGVWGPNQEKFFKGREVPADSRFRLFTELGINPVISSNSGVNFWGYRTVVYTLKCGNTQLGPYTSTYNVNF